MNNYEHASLPLTTAQRGLWVGQKMVAAGATMNIAEAVEICGRIDPALFQQALRQLACETETLRVRIVEQDGKPRQIIQPAYTGEFPFIDVSGEADPAAVAKAWMNDEVVRPLDLARDPLWVGALFKLADDRYYWYQRAHHAVFDGYSGGMTARRVAELYTAYAEGREPAPCEFAPLHTLIEAEAAYRGSDRYGRDRDYWKQQLAQLPEAVTLSRRTRRHSMGGLRRSIGHLSVDTTQRLGELGKRIGASLPQVLIGLVAAYYHRATGASDLVIGMPVSGRINATLRGAPGMVANAISIRLSLTAQTTATELFAQVSKTVRQSLRHQQYRYEDLRRDLGLMGQGQHIAWLGVNIEPFDYQLNFAGAGAIGHNMSNGSAEDLTVFVYDRGNGSELRFDFDANPALYSMDELDEHRRRLVRLIEAVLADPAQPLRQLDILGDEERQRQLVEWNDTAALLLDERLPAQVARQAELTPEAPAVMFERNMISYRELHARSVRQAQQLLADGVEPGDVVAVALPRSEQLLVVLLAIMRTGAAYLPIDLDSPAERTELVLADASPIALITLPEMNPRFARGGLLLLQPEQYDESSVEIRHAPDLSMAEGAAYVLYTSGSTGRPKGVEVTHRNLGNFLQGMRNQLKPVASDRFLALTTTIFDIAALELYLPLTVGARVVMASSAAAHNPPLLARLIRRSGVTHMQATPSLWRVLLSSVEAKLDGVHVLVGGEALSAELAGRLQQKAARVTQFYGPTETTVWSTAMELDRLGANEAGEAPPIGRPILNTRVYVLDEDCQLLPTGAIGELYIGGAGVAKGYLHRPQLTEERFPADPFANDGSRMYRTGDRVRWSDDGMLSFVGRIDGQVKIRGHRVELGEIETQLLGHPAIAAAAIAAHRDAEGAITLAGYLVAVADATIDLDDARAWLAGRLPSYMMPASFTLLETLPLTASGKLDRKALPAPERLSRAAYVEPVTPIEWKLAALWQQILGLERVGRHDNFFEIGGDSLKAAEMIARFPEHFSMELPLSSLFEASTIAGMAGYLQRADTQSDPLGPLLPLRVSQQERPLFCVHPVVGLSWGYANLLRHLDGQLPVYGLQARGLRDGAALPSSIEEVAADYLAQIRRIQPHGPYRLLGWSLGGLIAHAIAAQLLAQGQRVECLAMMDSYPFVTEAAQTHGDEAHEVRAILHFLGFHRLATENPPADMDALSEVLCREYDVFSVPLVQEIIKSDPRLIDHVSAVTRNNLRLARRYQPPRIDTDLLYFHAAAREQVEMSAVHVDGLLHYQPCAWRPFVGGRMEIHPIDCRHQNMLESAPAAQIGEVLRQKLAALHEATPRPASVLPPLNVGDREVVYA